MLCDLVIPLLCCVYLLDAGAALLLLLRCMYEYDCLFGGEGFVFVLLDVFF